MQPQTKFKVSIKDLKDAVHCANILCPENWQTEKIEIALLPPVKEALAKINHRSLNIERVGSKFGFGYILKGWNSLREEYYSTNPSVVADGLRREYYGACDLEFLRMVALSGDINDYAVSQLKYFEVTA